MLAIVASFSTGVPTATEWLQWKKEHNKVYASFEEEMTRLEAWSTNADALKARKTGWERLNEFADQAPAEFNKRNGYRSELAQERINPVHKMSGTAPPPSVDWRTKGLVAEVKNQGQCGSCWAFSTVASLEGQHAKKTGKLVSLSEQNLVDCVKGIKLANETDTCCNGCNGGLMDDAFEYLKEKQNGGIDTEAAYPYKGRDGTCSFATSSVGATISSFVDVPAGDEDALLDAVATVGPISVAVDASIGWQFYFGGILKPVLCSSKQGHMDHGVTVVGYGTADVNGTSTDYWIVKNSWGKFWGEKGYIRIIRGKNACGIANQASYPIDTASALVEA